MLYSFLISSFLLVSVFLAYWQRAHLLPLLPDRILSRLPASWRQSAANSAYRPLNTFDWASSADAGLNSSLFDIEANMRDGDSRSGLDEAGAAEVHRIMAQQGVSFDEARLIRHKAHLARNGIDPQTGMPLDSKAVTSLGGRR